MHCGDEFEEIERVCTERGISSEQLLEEKVAPFQQKISKAQGEVIGAIARHYTPCSHGMHPVHYALRETLYVGLITPETKIPVRGEEAFRGFLIGVKNPHSLDLSSSYEREFVEGQNGSFHTLSFENLRLVYFMGGPPQQPADSWKHGCFGSHSTVFPTEKPRLELHIGNAEAVSFLQKSLEGWRYLQIRGLLGYDLPMSEETARKVEQEQVKIFDEMREEEQRARNLVREKEGRLTFVRAGDGVINHGAYIELTDEFVEHMKYNPRIEESRGRVLRLLETAINRGYHETGAQIERRMDAGVVMKIDLKEFFSQRKAMFEL